MSKIRMEDVYLRSNRVGFAIFQKKPEFGPASIRVKTIKTENIAVPYLLEEESELVIDEKALEANNKNVKDILYDVQYGKSTQPL